MPNEHKITTETYKTTQEKRNKPKGDTNWWQRSANDQKEMQNNYKTDGKWS